VIMNVNDEYDGCTDGSDLDAEAGVEFVSGARPNIRLLSWQRDADWTLATVTRGYSGVYSTEIEEKEVIGNLLDLGKTKLKTPLAFINTVWLFKDVTRAFCNQLERYRVGTAFVQESLRFAKHQQVRVLVPADLGVENVVRYRRGVRAAVSAYHRAVEAGAAVQDARGMLPLNTLTSIFVSMNMQTLAHVYAQRMCCQAQQEEWTPVVKGMKECLEVAAPFCASFLQAPWEDDTCVDCGFKASFDRPCERQSLFEVNLVQMASRSGLL
jgi:hypothetical protein